MFVRDAGSRDTRRTLNAPLKTIKVWNILPQSRQTPSSPPPSHGMIYREATAGDLADIARLGELFYNESGYGEYTEYRYSSAFETLNFLLKSDLGVLVVAEEEDIVGIAGAILFPFHFNHEFITGQELFWWVQKEHRGCGGGLYQYLEEKAKEKGCQALIMIALETIKPAAVGKLYERKGYKKHENLYIKRL